MCDLADSYHDLDKSLLCNFIFSLSVAKADTEMVSMMFPGGLS